MKTDTLITVDLDSTLAPLDARQMGIHAEALAAVTDSLINLYKDKALAVIREYSTNARDAMVEAGNGGQPIRVTLPKNLDPVLTVQDFGIGMSKDQVLEFYSQYGASDKRNSNTQIGAFGFGCKAAFAISEQFTVVSVKDGWSTTAVFHRDAQGIGTASVLAHMATDAPNGVTVQVPVNDVSTMRDTATKFFKYWDKGTVLVDGAEPFSRYTDDDFTLGNVRLIKGDRYSYGNGNIFVRMGQVLYPFSGRTSWSSMRLPASVDLVLSAEIGDVDIVPSREGLRDTDRTTKWLNEQYTLLKENAKNYFADLVKSEPTYYGALKAYMNASTKLPEAMVSEVEWVNPVDKSVRVLSKSHSLAHLTNTITFTYNMYNENVVRNENAMLPIGDNHKVLVIDLPDGYDVEHVNRRLRRGMKLLFINDEYTHILINNDDLNKGGFGWFHLGLDIVETLSLEDYIEKRRALSAEARKNRDDSEPRSEVVYDVVIPSSVHAQGVRTLSMTMKELKAYKTFYYYRNPNNASRTHSSTVVDVIKRTPFDDFDTVVLVLNQWQQESTVQNRFPGARPFREYAISAVDKAVSNFSKQDIADIKSYRTTQESYQLRLLAEKLGSVKGKILDTELREWVENFTKDKNLTMPAWKRWGSLTSMLYSQHSEKLTALRELIETDQGFNFDNYPLLNALVGYSTITSDDVVVDKLKSTHALLYINMIYTSNNTKVV